MQTCRRSFAFVLTGILSVQQSLCVPGRLETAVYEFTDGGTPVVANWPEKHKLYVGIQSADPARRNLRVYDIGRDGKPEGTPRLYADHPDVLPSPIPSGGWSSITCMRVDTVHRKLLFGVGVAGVAPIGEQFKNPLVVYDLDEKGEPTGLPRAYDFGNPYKALNALAMHPSGKVLYVAGWGMAAVSCLQLDANGNPTGEPVVQPVGAHGKYSLAIRQDGRKLYAGAYQLTLEVCDLDENGAFTGKPRSYQGKNPPDEYLTRTVLLKGGLYVRGPGKRIACLPLDEQGEPAGELRTVGSDQVEFIAPGSAADRLVAAMPSVLPDVITGRPVTNGCRVAEMAAAADGALSVAAESEVIPRARPVDLASQPGVVVAVQTLGNGFLGNWYKGLETRVTVTDVQTEGVPVPVARRIAFAPWGQYLRFEYSAAHDAVYAASSNRLQWAFLSAGTDKVEQTALTMGNGVIALDEAAGTLYAATSDGRVAVRKVGPDGGVLPDETLLVAGVNPIRALLVHPRTRKVYVVGIPVTDVKPDASLIPVPGGYYDQSVALDAERGRLYLAGGMNGTTNVMVWKLDAAGNPAGSGPARFPDGFGKAGRRNLLGALWLNTAKRRLYVGGAPENPEAGETMIAGYDLDDSGDPVGKARVYPAGSQTRGMFVLSPTADGKGFYEGGWGYAGFYRHVLDEQGDPTGEPVFASVGSNGKSALQMTKDGLRLLAGSYDAALEVLDLRQDGTWIPGFTAVLNSDTRSTKIGDITEGRPSNWTNLDGLLQDRSGICVVRCELTGSRISCAKVKFEFRMKDVVSKPPAELSDTVLGNVAAVFVPGYGGDEWNDLARAIHTAGQHFERYREMAGRYAVAAKDRPKQFLVANGLIPVDASATALEAGLDAAAMVGHNSLEIWGWGNLPGEEMRRTAARHGFNSFRKAVYNPPSYFSYDQNLLTPEALDKWTSDFLTQGQKAMGMKPEELALFHIGDEPGWYYPSSIDSVSTNAGRLAYFHGYLKRKGFEPAFFGKTGWDQVKPIKLSEVKTREDRRLHLWTVRFFPECISEGFAATTGAMQRRFHPGVLTGMNLNNWPGTYFVPSPGVKIANNWDSGADAGMGLPDWFDLGRKKAVSCMWTEDWFGDSDAQNWSLYSDLLRCASREGGVEFGSYVIGHTVGRMPEGGVCKIMSLAGHGAKVFDFYIFASAYAFGDCWSEYEGAYRAFSEGTRMLGRSESLLYPGRPRDGTVAILFPQTSQAWNTNSAACCYMSELYGLHAGLIHESFPVDFIDDFDVEGDVLGRRQYSVLYVTAPNLSEKAQKAIVSWTKAGGTLVMMPGACAADEYNDPASVVTAFAGNPHGNVARVAAPRQHELAGCPRTEIRLTDTRVGTNALSTPAHVVTMNGGKDGIILAKYGGGTPAMTERKTGKGRVVSYGFWPGISYWFSPDRSERDRLPVGWSAAARQAVTYPARIAKARRHVEVSEPLVEACLLESDAGVAVTLLNWSGKTLDSVRLTIPGLSSSNVHSVEKGKIKARQEEGGLVVSLPLRTVDVLLIDRQ